MTLELSTPMVLQDLMSQACLRLNLTGLVLQLAWNDPDTKKHKVTDEKGKTPAHMVAQGIHEVRFISKFDNRLEKWMFIAPQPTANNYDIVVARLNTLGAGTCGTPDVKYQYTMYLLLLRHST